jgi:type VI secretion system protein ImpG
MSGQERFEQSWLAELQATEVFRRRYYGENRMARLDREDPDVRRMLEALCFSAVRTRQVTLRNLWSTWRRLLGSYFDFLLRPLPAMAMVQAVPTARMSETVVLPKGSELRLTTADGFPGVFTTLAELRVVPLTLDRCELLPDESGFRIVLSFSSRFPRTDAPGMLRLKVDYLDDYLAALQFHHNLRRHLTSAAVYYDSDLLPEKDAARCEVRFGSFFDEAYEADERNPLDQVRSFFHFPEQELLVNVQVPPPRRPFSRLSLCFNLAPDWPRDPPLLGRVFCPFVVPVQNLHRMDSQPIEWDGTRDSYPIRYTNPDPTFVLQSVRGVYRIGPKGLLPLPGAAWSDAPESYEVEGGEDGPIGGHSLLLRLPQAPSEPVRVVAAANWYQPEFADHAAGPLRVSLPDRVLLGVEWQVLGPIRRHLESSLCDSADQLLHLLSLKMKPTLTRDELLSLLEKLGSIAAGPYHALPARLRDLAIEVTPDANQRGSGLCHVYHVQLPAWPTFEDGLVWQFLSQLRVVLDAWDYEARVELAPHVGEAALPRPLPRSEVVLR